MTAHSEESHITSGCCYSATTRISNKTASKTTTHKTNRTIRFRSIGPSIGVLALLVVMVQFLAISQVDAMTLRPRQLRKRHSIHIEDGNWKYPCGGVYEASNPSEVMKKRIALNYLRKYARETFLLLNETKYQRIDTSDINVWSAHESTYKFLPKVRLRPNSTVTLSRWYRNDQTYVAAFSYLYKAQLLENKAKPNFEVTEDLKTLIYLARTMLCAIESTINHTMPHSRRKLVYSMTQEQMNRHLKFRTKHHLAENYYKVDPLDLKFTKHHFIEFAKNIWTILRRRRNSSNRSLMIADSGSGSSQNNSSSVANSQETSQPRRQPSGKKRLGRKQNRAKPRQKQINSTN